MQSELSFDHETRLTCGHNSTSNFTTGWDSSPHLFCTVCRAHVHKGRVWTRQEWSEAMEAAFEKEVKR